MEDANRAGALENRDKLRPERVCPRVSISLSEEWLVREIVGCSSG